MRNRLRIGRGALVAIGIIESCDFPPDTIKLSYSINGGPEEIRDINLCQFVLNIDLPTVPILGGYNIVFNADIDNKFVNEENEFNNVMVLSVDVEGDGFDISWNKENVFVRQTFELDDETVVQEKIKISDDLINLKNIGWTFTFPGSEIPRRINKLIGTDILVGDDAIRLEDPFGDCIENSDRPVMVDLSDFSDPIGDPLLSFELSSCDRLTFALELPSISSGDVINYNLELTPISNITETNTENNSFVLSLIRREPILPKIRVVQSQIAQTVYNPRLLGQDPGIVDLVKGKAAFVTMDIEIDEVTAGSNLYAITFINGEKQDQVASFTLSGNNFELVPVPINTDREAGELGIITILLRIGDPVDGLPIATWDSPKVNIVETFPLKIGLIKINECLTGNCYKFSGGDGIVEQASFDFYQSNEHGDFIENIFPIKNGDFEMVPSSKGSIPGVIDQGELGVITDMHNLEFERIISNTRKFAAIVDSGYFGYHGVRDSDYGDKAGVVIPGFNSLIVMENTQTTLAHELMHTFGLLVHPNEIQLVDGFNGSTKQALFDKLAILNEDFTIDVDIGSGQTPKSLSDYWISDLEYSTAMTALSSPIIDPDLVIIKAIIDINGNVIKSEVIEGQTGAISNNDPGGSIVFSSFDSNGELISEVRYEPSFKMLLEGREAGSSIEIETNLSPVVLSIPKSNFDFRYLVSDDLGNVIVSEISSDVSIRELIETIPKFKFRNSRSTSYLIKRNKLLELSQEIEDLIADGRINLATTKLNVLKRHVSSWINDSDSTIGATKQEIIVKIETELGAID